MVRARTVGVEEDEIREGREGLEESGRSFSFDGDGIREEEGEVMGVAGAEVELEGREEEPELGGEHGVGGVESARPLPFLSDEDGTSLNNERE